MITEKRLSKLVPVPSGSGICFSEGRSKKAGVTDAGLQRETGIDRNHRMELQYDGTGLHGWAKQEGLPTVEGHLEAALATVLGHTPELRVAGRTDAGVHARRQVVSLRLPLKTDLPKLTASLNALTPPGIAVIRVTRVAEAFDARRDAAGRTYRYFVSTGDVVSPFWARYCWRRQPGLDLAALRSAAAATVGRHDFTAFTPTETEHVFFDRLVTRCAWKRVTGDFPGGLAGGGGGWRDTGTGAEHRDSAPEEGHHGGAATTGAVREGADHWCGTSRGRGAPVVLFLEIEAEAFLRHMVRTLVGTMMEVAEGGRDIEGFVRLLSGAARGAAGPTAPAQGLFLWDVRYAPRRAWGDRAAKVESG